MSGRAVCERCASGQHPHDTFTGDRAGEDAGCPMAVDGHECRCQVRLPKARAGEDLAAWVTRALGVQLLPWQREFLKRWERR